MSERTSGEGNTDAPRVEENEVRSGDSHRNQERGSTQGMSYELSHGYKKTSWTSVIFGWLAALGAGLILSGMVGAVVGGILGALGVKGGTEGGIAGLVGLLIILVLAIVGTIVGASFIDQLSGVALPQVPGNVQNQAPQSLGTILTASGIAALVVPFVGGALGGLWGAKTGRNRP